MAVFSTIACLFLFGLILLLPSYKPLGHGLFVLGFVGIARYGWLAINLVRAFLYRFHAFPGLREAASRLPDPFPERVHFIIPTYKEKPWVTRVMLESIVRESARIPSRVDLYITTGGPDEDEVMRRVLESCPDNDRMRVYLMRQSGKRSGMAYALRAVARNNPGHTDGIVVLMDGDTLMGPDILVKTLPFFRLLPRLGGLTTNSVSSTVGPQWYRDWYTIRFALRNRYMCSVSLSHKILTLTGRFSLIRSSLATSRSFIERLERDFTEDWTYGRIDFKTGDDKSTWYELLKDGWDMLYVPDATIYSLENASSTPVSESIGKMRRWFGNMLRNNGRAIALGPVRTGVFPWFSLLDQRISMWTSLVLPLSIPFMLIKGDLSVFFFLLIWILGTRSAYLIALGFEGHRPRVSDLALLLFQQWVGSFIKIQTFSDLRRQKWGAARGDARTDSSFFGHLQTAIWLLIFILALAWLIL